MSAGPGTPPWARGQSSAHGTPTARHAVAGSSVYIASEFFEEWNHRHSEDVLTVKLTESILRHENDFTAELSLTSHHS